MNLLKVGESPASNCEATPSQAYMLAIVTCKFSYRKVQRLDGKFRNARLINSIVVNVLTVYERNPELTRWWMTKNASEKAKSRPQMQSSGESHSGKFPKTDVVMQ